MKNDSIRAEWEAMKDDARYGPHLANNEEAWWQNLAAVKTYIDRNQKAPSAADKHARRSARDAANEPAVSTPTQ
jgi:hypothetical protein